MGWRLYTSTVMADLVGVVSQSLSDREMTARLREDPFRVARINQGPTAALAGVPFAFAHRSSDLSTALSTTPSAKCKAVLQNQAQFPAADRPKSRPFWAIKRRNGLFRRSFSARRTAHSAANHPSARFSPGIGSADAQRQSANISWLWQPITQS